MKCQFELTWALQTNRDMLVGTWCYMHCASQSLCVFVCISFFYIYSHYASFLVLATPRTPLQLCNIIVKSISCSLSSTVLPALIFFHLYRVERYATLRLFYDIIRVSVCFAHMIMGYSVYLNEPNNLCVCVVVAFSSEIYIFLWWIHRCILFNKWICDSDRCFGLLCAFRCYVPFNVHHIRALCSMDMHCNGCYCYYGWCCWSLQESLFNLKLNIWM